MGSRFTFILTLLILVFSITCNTSALESELSTEQCVKCHKEVYDNALSNQYQHSVTNQCPKCHVNPESNDIVTHRLTFAPLIREGIVYLGELSEDQFYYANVTGTDRSGNVSDPVTVEIMPGRVMRHREQYPEYKLQDLSNISVDEITKRAYVKAAISWTTNTFATSEIVYRMSSEPLRSIGLEKVFTKEHNIELDGLMHKRTYYFRVVSTDIYGNTLRSGEYTIDTSGELSRKSGHESDNKIQLDIEGTQVFRKDRDNGLYLRVSANRLSSISVLIKEKGKKDENHSVDLFPARKLKIDVCYSCHPHGSSHPVGIKAESPKVSTPQGLPTIEDGIITCVTCHEPHGGNRKYYHRVDFKKALCMRCHARKYSLD